MTCHERIVSSTLSDNDEMWCNKMIVLVFARDTYNDIKKQKDVYLPKAS